MRAVMLERPGELVLADQAEPPAPGPGEVLVAARRVGLCGTDYHAFAGNQNFFSYPRVLGHELAVEVLEVGRDVDNVRTGDACAVLPYLPCGACGPCRIGRMNCCERLDVLGVTVDGGLRERLIVPATALFGRPGLDFDALALVETLGIGFHAVQRSAVKRGQFALVVGAGPIGLAVGQVLLAAGVRVAITDTSSLRRDTAARIMAVEAVAPGDGLAERLAEIGDGHLPAVVFDATGNRQSMESSLGLVGFAGSLVLVGHTTGSITFDNPTLHRREITVLASRNALAAEWSPLLDLIESGSIGGTNWITNRSTLDRLPVDLPEWGASPGTTLKGIVEIGSDEIGSDEVGTEEVVR
ncbi:MAG: zinc-binding alcohol dehydrogenase family protein [Ilumatobacteraceae bacterium]